jgi:hypothetical protein
MFKKLSILIEIALAVLILNNNNMVHSNVIHYNPSYVPLKANQRDTDTDTSNSLDGIKNELIKPFYSSFCFFFI